MKSNPIFNHDFNKYNLQVIKLKSKQSSIKRIVAFFAVLLLFSAFFLTFNISNSSATQNTKQNISSALSKTIHEELVLPERADINNTQVALIAEFTTTKPTTVKSPTVVATVATTTSQSKILASVIKTNQTSVTTKKAIASKKTQQTLRPIANTSKLKLIKYKVRKGDNLASIFKKNQLSKKLLHHIIYNTEHGKQLARIRPGQIINFEVNDTDNKLQSISLHKNKIETLLIALTPAVSNDTVDKQNKVPTSYKFVSSIELKKIEKRQQFVNVTINGSLFLSATKAGLSEKFTMELAHLFGWDIDFALEIRNGDSFSVLFNEHFVDGKKVANGQILIAEFNNQGKNYQTIYYTDNSGKSDYYSIDGYSKRRAFLRTPVAFSRISSRFSGRRKHPVLNRIRAHKGVDYAAPRGTPVKSSGDGRISFRGRKGGYGNIIQIKHGSKYMTVYAHLSSFNRKLKRGSKVKQGQIIAYVGSTGVATGPHLHYEFRVNGVHRNPLTVKLPKANPINKKYLKGFMLHSENMISSLKLKKHEQLALLKQL